MRLTGRSLGRHVIAELYGCDPEILNDAERLEEVLVEAARRAGAEVITSSFHRFSPYGVSGVVIIAESHISIHTWPEYGYAALDFYTCGDHVNPWAGFDYVAKFLEPKTVNTVELKRGILPIPGTENVAVSVAGAESCPLPGTA